MILSQFSSFFVWIKNPSWPPLHDIRLYGRIFFNYSFVKLPNLFKADLAGMFH